MRFGLGPRSDAESPHPHGHAHGGLPSADVPTSRTSRIVTLSILAAVALATLWGLIGLWPDYAEVSETAERVPGTVAEATYERAEVISVTTECAAGPAAGSGSDDRGSSAGTGSDADVPGTPAADADPAALSPCPYATFGLRTGPDSGRLVDIPLRGIFAGAGLQPGDTVELVGFPGPDSGAAPDAAAETGAGSDADADDSDATAAPGVQRGLSLTYNLSGIDRTVPLVILFLIFAVVVIAVGRLRGFFALLALGVSAGVILAFMLPALVAGSNGILIALVGASAIMFVTLFFVHGANMRTVAALVGTLCGILIMAGVSVVAVSVTRLSGLGDESSGILSSVTSSIDFRGLLTCAIIVAGLGILNDVTITQASSVWELRAAAPEMSRWEVYQRAMRIGRDHIASTVYTVFFAYVGAALSVLILMYLYDRPTLSLLTFEDIATEIVRTLCGSIGLILAVPITTWAAAMFTAPTENSQHRGAGDPQHARTAAPEQRTR